MNRQQFFHAVVALRRAQRQAQSSGTASDRAEAARLEALIDREIRLTHIKLYALQVMKPLGAELVSLPSSGS